MNYAETMDYLANLTTFGINLGLTRIERLLAMMQHPERRFKTIHVTGTNGKGSTTAMLTAMLTAAGIRTGMYTSPHLSDYPERMIINDKMISKEEFAKVMTYTAGFVDKLVAEGVEQPTEFEVITAAAFYYFAAAGVEYAVIEVGLGGLLDSTNVIVPEISVITNVTLEHTDRCGDTVTAIAGHKAGIIKAGKPVVTAARGEALAVIKKTALEKGSQVYCQGEDFSAKSQGVINGKQQVVVTAEKFGVYAEEINVLGRHQVENGAVAVMTALVLSEKETRITPAVIKAGLAVVTWPGRFEVRPGKPLLVIDGAHNPDGARTLRQNLDDAFPGRKITFALGILKDKDVAGIINTMIHPEDVVVTVQPNSYRAATAEEVAAQITASHVETATSIGESIVRAKELAGEEGIVCVAGSLYLIGEARELILAAERAVQ